MYLDEGGYRGEDTSELTIIARYIDWFPIFEPLVVAAWEKPQTHMVPKSPVPACAVLSVPIIRFMINMGHLFLDIQPIPPSLPTPPICPSPHPPRHTGHARLQSRIHTHRVNLSF